MSSIEKEVAEFETEISTFAETKLPISASKIENAMKMALKHAKNYKHVVFIMEKFVAKSQPEYKIAIFYTIDSLLKVFKKDSASKFSQLSARLESKLENFFANFDTISSTKQQVSEKDQDRLRRLSTLWAKNELISPATVATLAQKYPKYFSDIPSNPGVDGTKSSIVLPDTASLVATLAQLNSTSIPGNTTADPLAFDYGDDDDDDENGTNTKLKRKRAVGSGNHDEEYENGGGNGNGKEGKFEDENILQTILSSISNNSAAPLPSPLQTTTTTTFTPHQQQQLFSLLSDNQAPISPGPKRLDPRLAHHNQKSL